MKQAAVGDFIKYVIEAMGGATLNSAPTEEEQEKLAANPYTFKPNDDKMAIFHAHLRHQLSLPASQYYEHAQHYLTGDTGWELWQGGWPSRPGGRLRPYEARKQQYFAAKSAHEPANAPSICSARLPGTLHSPPKTSASVSRNALKTRPTNQSLTYS